MRDDRERLLDMLEAIQKIEQYADDETFSSQNENLVEVWMIHYESACHAFELSDQKPAFLEGFTFVGGRD